MTQANPAKLLEDAVNGSAREDTEIQAPPDDAGVVVPVRFGKDDFEKISKFADDYGIPMSTFIRDATVEKIEYETEKSKLHKQWAESARLRREQGIRLPSIWDAPNDDDMDEWLREE